MKAAEASGRFSYDSSSNQYADEFVLGEQVKDVSVPQLESPAPTSLSEPVSSFSASQTLQPPTPTPTPSAQLIREEGRRSCPKPQPAPLQPTMKMMIWIWSLRI
ncbi:uncharacterized protein LOC120349372 [Nilaparvata lugens]|uniref:uncharacterized protein LOC120349372 n=1 Tax=Nilaparvata lugens TaxID=108931 RepID=UPI00193DC26D|nr:uncharacterized protein LOC120349372 [Nilaparvata lugens]